MATDRSDPDEVERELQRLEKELSGDTRSDMRLLVAVMRAVLKAQKRTDARTATLIEDIATLHGLIDRSERARTAESQPPVERGLATQIVEAEGRIVGHVDHLAESIRTVRDALPDIEKLARTAASTPERLERLATGVERSAEAVRAQDTAIRANTDRLTELVANLDEKLPAMERSVTDRFAEEAKGVRGTLQETAAVVLRRRSRSRWFWLTLAGVFALTMLAGVWVQWKFVPVPAQDPTGGWRDGIWNDYGPIIRDCILEAIDTERTVGCPIAPPPS